MNILVTGANGQLGNEMRIIAKGRPSISSALPQSPEQRGQKSLEGDFPLNFIFTDVVEQEGVETTYLDITDLEAIRTMVKVNNVNAIVNCAAWTNVDGAEDPEKYALVEKLNATAPENLAKAMKEVGGWLVQISTDYVFGKEPYNTPCREDQTGTPTGVYGATKLLGEQKIMSVFEADDSSPSQGDKRGSYMIIRTAWLYSEFGKNFCKTMLNLTATKPQLKVVFDQCGTPTYAWDLAVAIVTALKQPVEGIYHFSNEGVCSWYDFTKMIQQIALEVGYYESLPTKGDLVGLCDVQPCHSNEFPSPVTRPSYSVLDKTKIKETFGLKIPYWTDSLKICINNLKK